MMSFYHNRYVRLMAGAAMVAGVLVAYPASAHQLGNNNGVSVVLHVEPDDQPIAAGRTQLELFFGSTTGPVVFDDTHCSCDITVVQAGKTLEKVPLVIIPNKTTEASASVTFPRSGTYDVVVSGSSTNGGFPAFRVPFAVHVDAAPAATSIRTKTVEQVAFFAIAGLAVIGWIAWYLRRRRSTEPEQTV